MLQAYGGNYMKLYVTRHGETEWNREDRILGTTDIPLNEKGIRQAESIAAELPQEIDLIIASPLMRAARTAGIIAEKNEIELIYDNRLTEMNFGIYEGIDRSNATYQAEKRKFFSRYPEGESFLKVAQRVYNLLDEILEKYPDRTILIVTHNGICRVINTYFSDVENEDFAAFSLKNCELKSYEVS
jgi:Fructose-2,6-bisphosphatase